MDYKTVVDVSSVIGASAVIFGVLRFFYQKAKIASEKQHHKNQSLKTYIETLLSKATSDTKRNEILPFVSLLANNQAQLSIDMRLRFNLMSIISFIIVLSSSALLFVKTDGELIYQENENIFVLGVLIIIFNIGIAFTILMYSRILKKLEHMQEAINETYIQSFGAYIDNKYLVDKT